MVLKLGKDRRIGRRDSRAWEVGCWRLLQSRTIQNKEPRKMGDLQVFCLRIFQWKKTKQLLLANGVIIKGDCEDCASKTTRIIDKLHGEIAKLRKAQQWIPVSKMLPDNDCPVLVTCGRGYRPFIARYDRVRKRWRVSHTLRITHWMQLPHSGLGDFNE